MSSMSQPVPFTPPSVETRSSRCWQDVSPPERVLLMRFHALGDVALTLPCSAWLRETLPDCRIDYLSTAPANDILGASGIFSNVYILESAGGRLARIAHSVRFAWSARRVRYDIVIDLQRNWPSRLIRRMLHPTAWAEFDRYSPRSAASRTRAAFAEAGLRNARESFMIPIPERLLEAARAILRERGWNGSDPLVVLNPAGLWPSRNWPVQSYVELADLLISHHGVRPVLLGTDRIRDAATALEDAQGTRVINLCGQTDAGLALAVLRHVAALVTEDSGLMHMAWALGKPMVTLFGSSYHTWSAPTGQNVRTLDSGDLPCGACMQPECRYGDTHCLTRWDPAYVASLLGSLLVPSITEAHP